MMRKKQDMVMLVAMVIALAVVSDIFAAALTAARDTPSRSGDLVAVGVASNTTIYVGAMVAVDATGYAVPAADATGLRVIGRAESTVDNSGTAGAGAQTIAVRRGVFRWTNGDTFTRADVGALAFVEDDGQVQKAAAATYDIIAGSIIDVDADGVWVDTYHLGSQGSATLAAVTVQGNGTVGGTLGVAGVATFTAESVHNGGIDADYITTDAAAGIDSKTAGALAIGAVTATSVDVSKAGAMTTVKGTLNVDQAATFDATVVATGDVKGATLSIGSGSLARVDGTLVWIEGGVTNALDADVTQ
jgi:hypothetical protein